ncbi:DNA gyrase subunit A [Candidatus Woesearchaeota archaeon]|nr:DNA gyrase subunit A [Candidatus Woesearchaeota archaeon]
MADNNNSQEQNMGQNVPKENIKIAVIEDEMKTAYLDYSMSVIIGRALPDVRDGLKPVHRRIMHAMNEMGLTHNKSFKKSARIVGEVLGKYHPHGDTAVYDSLVRMAQEFSLRYPLIKGQGNFGSVDGDSPAAMRYTEAKLEKISNSILADIDKETVDMRPNFDESLEEPVVLPTRIPNLLVNGSSGIAVGMATNIPPHNLKEVVDGTIHLLENGEETEINDLIEIVKGPDFPTGAIIQGTSGIKQAYLTGRGKIKVKAVMHEEEIRNRTAIIVTEIPYQVNKASLIEQIADAVRDKRIEGISDLRDESDRTGMRIVIELKRDANIEVVKNQLLKHSRLQIGTGIIFLSIVNGEPKILGLKDMLSEFIKHRKEVVTRRTKYDLAKAEKKAHLLEGLTKALDHIDPIITLIKAADSAQIAKDELIEKYDFSEEQAQAILDMKLQKLTGLEQDKIREEHKGLVENIAELKSILESTDKVKEIIRQELIEVKELYGDERKTQIIEGEDDDIDFEDLIVRENQVVNITQTGYAKRLPIDTYKLQNRGGKGVIGASMKEEDIIEHLFIANTHSYLLIFTDRGQAHWLKVYKIPEGTRQAKGKPLINLVNLQQGEKVAAVIPVEEFREDEYLMMVTKKGIVKKTSLEAYSRPRTNGIIGITLDDGDKVIKVLKTSGKDQILIASENGQAVKFNEQDARPIGRTSRGVRGITLAKNDNVVGMILAKEEETILTVTENGYGKRTPISEYRLINRGGKGVRNIICSERNGKVASVRRIQGNEDILMISEKGIIVRIPSSQISTIGRNTQGLRVMRLVEGDKVKSCAVVISEEEQEE